MDTETKQLIWDAQQGNQFAFHELVRQHDERIMSLAYQLTRNPQDAEDLYQDVFLKAWKAIATFRFESEFYTWLYRITVNSALNLKRKQQRLPLAEGREESDWDPLMNLSAEEDREAESREIRLRVNQALQALPKQQQIVFILKHLQNLKIKDIARIMNLSEGTVKKYLFRAVEKLRVQLKELRYV